MGKELSLWRICLILLSLPLVPYFQILLLASSQTTYNCPILSIHSLTLPDYKNFPEVSSCRHPWIKYCCPKFTHATVKLSYFRLRLHHLIFRKRKKGHYHHLCMWSDLQLDYQVLWPIHSSHLMNTWTQVSFRSKFKQWLEIYHLLMLLFTF